MLTLFENCDVTADFLSLQNELVGEPAPIQALASAKVLQVITAEQNDAWYRRQTPASTMRLI